MIQNVREVAESEEIRPPPIDTNVPVNKYWNKISNDHMLFVSSNSQIESEKEKVEDMIDDDDSNSPFKENSVSAFQAKRQKKKLIKLQIAKIKNENDGTTSG